MKKVIVFALICIAVALLLYIDTFGFTLSDKHSRWAGFGSFFGGTLGPIFTLGSLLYLARQLEEQVKENRRTREQSDINYRERDIEMNLSLISTRLNANDLTINSSLAELVLCAFREKDTTENNLELFKLGFSARAETLVMWVNISAALTVLKAVDENRFLSQKTLVAIQLSYELCAALDYVVGKATGIEIETHF